MESIAVTKPDMGVLSRKRLLLSPFGALAQAFLEELLARAGTEEGRYPFVPLDLLEEDNAAVPAPDVQPVIQVDLNLVLEALRQAGSKTEQERITERIVERIVRTKERETVGPAPEGRVLQQGEPAPEQAVRQELIPILEQQAQK